MSNLSTSYIHAESAKALSRGMSPERFAERSAAYTQKEQSEQELKMLKNTKPTDADYEKLSEINSQKLDLAIGELKQQKRQQNLQRTHQAFQLYDSDKFNVKHFNQLLIDFEARGAELFNDIARVDRINTTDIPDMDRWGVSKADQKTILEDPRAKGTFVKITQKDGNTRFGNMDILKNFAGGYNDYAAEQEIKRQTTVQHIMYMNSVGRKTDTNSLQAWNETRQNFPNTDPTDAEFIEAYQARYEELRASRRGFTNSDGLTQEEAYAKRTLAAKGIDPSDPNYDQLFLDAQDDYSDDRKRGTRKRYDEDVVAAEKELTTMGFWSMDFAEISSEERMDVEPLIRRIENMGDAKLTTGMQDTMQDVAELMHLGDAAGELTDEQTGLWDSLLYGVKQYIFDVVPGTEATRAYAALRNVSRHDLFGSVLPQGERKDFNQAFGSLGMQQGPVLDKLRAYLGDLKHGFETMQQLGHPMVMKYRTGMTKRQIRDTIRRLDERISMVNAIANDSPQTVESPNIKPNDKIELDPVWEIEFDKSFPKGDDE